VHLNSFKVFASVLPKSYAQKKIEKKTLKIILFIINNKKCIVWFNAVDTMINMLHRFINVAFVKCLDMVKMNVQMKIKKKN
jgi:hypothetical protein